MISPTNIISVRGGREGAMMYPLQAGYTALLLDEENKMFFIKKSDGSPMREFKFEEIQSTPVAADPSKYATKDDINAIMARLDDIERAQTNRYSQKFNKPRRNDHDGQRYSKPDVR